MRMAKQTDQDGPTYAQVIATYLRLEGRDLRGSGTEVAVKVQATLPYRHRAGT